MKLCRVNNVRRHHRWAVVAVLFLAGSWRFQRCLNSIFIQLLLYLLRSQVGFMDKHDRRLVHLLRFVHFWLFLHGVFGPSEVQVWILEAGSVLSIKMILVPFIPLPPLLRFVICSLVLVAVHVDGRLVLAVGLLWWTGQCADYLVGSRDEAFDLSYLGCKGCLTVLVVIVQSMVGYLALPLFLLPVLLTCH